MEEDMPEVLTNRVKGSATNGRTTTTKNKERTGRPVKAMRPMDGTRAADPARPFGPKAKVLVARRRACQPACTASMLASTTTGAKSGSRELDSMDGHLHLHLEANPCGLVVEWSQRGVAEVQLTQCMLLDSIQALHVWIDAEVLRHKDPGLHQRLCRAGEEMLDGQGH
jgi:hypothetical protein